MASSRELAPSTSAVAGMPPPYNSTEVRMEKPLLPVVKRRGGGEAREVGVEGVDVERALLQSANVAVDVHLQGQGALKNSRAHPS